MIRRHNEGMVNANMYLNLTNTIVKKNTVGSAHMRYCTVYSTLLMRRTVH